MRGSLALLVRSLRQDARSLRPHLLRLALVVPNFMFLYYAQSVSVFMGAPGQKFFQPVAYLNFFLITLAGTSFFATAITEEKEEMTLGLLRMAGISPLSLLLGKSTTRLFSTALILSAQFPFTLLAIMLGGVTLSQIVATYFSLLAYMLLLSSLGLLCSVYCSRSGRAAILATVVIATLLIGPTIFSWIWMGVIQTGLVDPFSSLAESMSVVLLWIDDISAFHRIGVISWTGFADSAFSMQVIVHTITAVVLFVVAWLTFDLFNRDETSATPARGILPQITLSLGGNRGRSRRAWQNAFVWKDFQFLSGGIWLQLIKFGVYLVVGAVIFVVSTYFDPGGGWDRDLLGGTLLWVALFGAAVEISITASRVFREETRWKTLSGLAMLPTSLVWISYSKLLGCLLGFLSVAAVFVLGTMIHPSVVWKAFEKIVTEPWHWVWICQLILFWHLVTFLSLHVKWGSLPLAVAIILIADFLAYFGLILLFLASSWGGGLGSQDETIIRYVLPLGIVAGHVVVSGILHYGIGTRLSRLAAD